MTPPPTTEEGRHPTNVAGGPLLEPHDGGCRCWPHVSQADALKAVEHAALMEYRSSVAAPPSEQKEPPARPFATDEHGLPNSDERRRAAYVITSLPTTLRLAFLRESARQIGYEVTERAGSTPVPALRHHSNDNCGDPEHDAILEAWYARANALLDRSTPVPALDPTRLKQAFHNHDTTHNGGCGWWCSDDLAAEYLRLSGDEGGAG